MVDNDKVHLTNRMNRIAAASLMYRMLEKKGSDPVKQQRMECRSTFTCGVEKL